MNLGVADLDACWPFVLARVGRAAMTPGALQALRERCAAGAAVCVAGADGVVVVTPQERPGGTMRAMVLLAVSTGAPGAFQRQEEEMAGVARELGATELAFTTSRRGWARLLGKHWRFDGEVFSRSV